MRVKSLQIAGFKSFVDKTVFSFQPGITAVVGPNGCGKSNVVDAIRWAMGEQSPRRLRGKGMEDVIFAGSETAAPVGLAEVVLTFDNGDGTAPPAFAQFTEIQVSRRLYRSGESEYLINKVPCRLRDVLDFFRDTGIGTKGYTIVEQGRIAEIVSAKPEERRVLIEEAAGISKYKARRKEAESKLHSTEQNLVRVTDVLGEIKRQISSIERQARKAARYKRLRETQRLLDLSLASHDRDQLLAGIEGARTRVAGLQDRVVEDEARLAERESSLEQERLDLVDRERELGQASEALFQLRGAIKDLEGQISYDRRERASLGEANQAREAERERLAARRVEVGEEARRLEDELRGVDAALAVESESMAQAEREAAEAGRTLQGLEAEREAVSAQLVEVLTGIARAEDRLSGLDDRRAEIDRRVRSADEQLELQLSEASQVEGAQRDLEEGLRNLLAERDRLMGQLRSALERHETRGRAVREAAERLHRAREQREQRRARLSSLREVLERREDVAAGARHLLAQGETSRRTHGLRALVRDVLEVERDLEPAVQAVLAERAEGLVVERPEGALSALASLRAEQGGRGVFVVPPQAERPLGFVPLGTPLLDRVRVREGYESAARALLGDVNLVEDLAEAARHYPDRLPCTFVTPLGDVMTPEGVVRGGGGEGTGAGPLARAREVRELEAEVARLDAEVARLEAEALGAEDEAARASDELENLRNRHHTAALAVANHEKDLERTRERVKALGQAQEGRVAERSALLSETDSLGTERERLETRLREARELRGGRQRELDALGLRVGSAGRELKRLEAVVTERRVQHGGRAESRERLASELERARQAAQETAEWIARREEEIRSADARREELARRIQHAELGLAERLREEEVARQGNETLRDAYEQAAEALRGREQQARALREELSQQREQAQQAELGLRERQLELQHLEGQTRDKWGVDLASWKPPVPVAETPGSGPGADVAAEPPEAGDEAAEADAAAAGPAEEDGRDAQREARANAELLALAVEERRAKLEEVRGRIESIGEVNLGAIEEHEELGERFRFLSEQKGDLDHSIAQLRDAIARINRTSRKRFRETFDAVNARFEKNFPRLFRGGKANLALSESEDVLEAGIEIMAQPPGKRLQSVNLLSGGEKTMTAIALLVSVFQVKPAPFFLLDEVDAALDDANVGRFNEMVVELAGTSQFLLITHNKRTIEIADVLYGVTMEKKGVSKLVSVELH